MYAMVFSHPCSLSLSSLPSHSFVKLVGWDFAAIAIHGAWKFWKFTPENLNDDYMRETFHFIHAHPKHTCIYSCTPKIIIFVRDFSPLHNYSGWHILLYKYYCEVCSPLCCVHTESSSSH